MANSKKANKEDYKSLSEEVLQDKIEEETMRLKKLKFGHAVNPIENPMIIKAVRRTIAQYKTEQRKRELGS